MKFYRSESSTTIVFEEITVEIEKDHIEIWGDVSEAHALSAEQLEIVTSEHFMMKLGIPIHKRCANYASLSTHANPKLCLDCEQKAE